MQKLKPVDLIALVLLVVGGLNWGLMGLGMGNVVESIFGTLSRLIYILVGLSAVYIAWLWMKLERK